MRSYIAVSLFAFSASVLSAPTPQIASIVGSGNNNGNGNSLIGGNSLLSDNKVNVDVDGLTDGLLHEKRQVDDVVGGLTRPASNTLEDVTKVRVLGNARRQLTAPLVPGALKTVDTVTDSVNLNGAVSGLNTHVNSKRQLNVPGVGFATAKLDQVTDSLNTKGAVEGLDTDVHNKRQLTAPVVPGALSAVDSVTGKLNLNGAVTGLNTNVNSKRQLNAPGVGFATAKLDQVTDSLNTKGAVEGLDTDVHNKRQLLDLSGLNGVADAAGLITKPLDSITNALPGPENKKAKRDIPLVSDLPVVGGLTDPVNHLPVAGELINTVDQAVPDLSGVESTLYDAAKPVTDATNVLDVKRHEQAGVVDSTVGTAGGAVGTAGGVVNTAEGTVGGVTGTVSGVTGTANGAVGTVKGLAGLNGEKVENEVESGNNNGNNNSLIGGNSLLSGNSINL